MPDDPKPLPRYDDFRDPNQPEEPDVPDPVLYPSVPSWAICGALVAGFVGFLSELIPLLAREDRLFAASMVVLLKASLWAVGGAVLGAIIGGLRDEYRRRQRRF